MRIRELAMMCEDRDIDCDFCPYKEICDNLQEQLEDISPCGLVEMIDEDKFINQRNIWCKKNKSERIKSQGCN